MRLDRLLGITVQLLASKKRVTAPELAQQFEVSVRTIYRDIDVLAQAGIPIVAHAGVEGGFEIMEQFALSKQLFSLAELSFLYQLLEKNGVSTVSSRSGQAGGDSTPCYGTS